MQPYLPIMVDIPGVEILTTYTEEGPQVTLIPVSAEPAVYPSAPAPYSKEVNVSNGATGTTWKPDFTKPDPWVGVPADYAGVATFIPTQENPLPPWEGQPGSEVIPAFGSQEYNERALEIVYTAQAQGNDFIAEAGAKALVARQVPITLAGRPWWENLGPLPWIALAGLGLVLLSRKK